VKLETMFISELMPHIDRTFRTVAAREGRIIEGFSMGGYGAARLGFKHPLLFAAVSLLGAGPLQAEFTETPRAGPRERDRVLNTVYGGDLAYYRTRAHGRSSSKTPKNSALACSSAKSSATAMRRSASIVSSSSISTRSGFHSPTANSPAFRTTRISCSPPSAMTTGSSITQRSALKGTGI
jgi:S-formylglutathione hydrolase FrmB